MKFALMSFALLATSAAAFSPMPSIRASSSALNIAVGESIPADATMLQGFPDVQTINIADYIKDKNIIIGKD